MKFLFDLLPVILFFLTYKFAHHGTGNECLVAPASASTNLVHEPILLATAVAIAATIFQVSWLLARRKKIDVMLWVSLLIIVVFGGATLYFRNPTFIQWKPSILYWSFGSILLVSPVVFGKNLIQTMMQEQLSLPTYIWKNLNLAWAGLFVILGFANLAVMQYFSCDGWVNFKLYGTTSIIFGFSILQALMLSKHLNEESP